MTPKETATFVLLFNLCSLSLWSHTKKELLGAYKPEEKIGLTRDGMVLEATKRPLGVSIVDEEDAVDVHFGHIKCTRFGFGNNVRRMRKCLAMGTMRTSFKRCSLEKHRIKRFIIELIF